MENSKEPVEIKSENSEKILPEKVEQKIDINHINSMCAFENQSYKTCLEIGERNFQTMKGFGFKFLPFFI